MGKLQCPLAVTDLSGSQDTKVLILALLAKWTPPCLSLYDVSYVLEHSSETRPALPNERMAFLWPVQGRLIFFLKCSTTTLNITGWGHGRETAGTRLKPFSQKKSKRTALPRLSGSHHCTRKYLAECFSGIHRSPQVPSWQKTRETTSCQRLPAQQSKASCKPLNATHPYTRAAGFLGAPSKQCLQASLGELLQRTNRLLWTASARLQKMEMAPLSEKGNSPTRRRCDCWPSSPSSQQSGKRNIYPTEDMVIRRKKLSDSIFPIWFFCSKDENPCESGQFKQETWPVVPRQGTFSCMASNFIFIWHVLKKVLGMNGSLELLWRLVCQRLNQASHMVRRAWRSCSGSNLERASKILIVESRGPLGRWSRFGAACSLPFRSRWRLDLRAALLVGKPKSQKTTSRKENKTVVILVNNGWQTWRRPAFACVGEMSSCRSCGHGTVKTICCLSLFSKVTHAFCYHGFWQLVPFAWKGSNRSTKKMEPNLKMFQQEDHEHVLLEVSLNWQVHWPHWIDQLQYPMTAVASLCGLSRMRHSPALKFEAFADYPRTHTGNMALGHARCSGGGVLMFWYFQS